MTIYKTDNFVEHFGNGLTVEFPYEFYIPDADSLIVTVISGDAETVLDPAFYTVTGLGGDESGGYVRYPIIEPGTPLASFQKLRITRDTALTQETVFSDQTRYNAGAHQTVSDKLTTMVIDLFDRVRRAPAGAITGVRDMVFPQPVAHSALVFDEAGQLTASPIGVSSVVTSIEFDNAAQVAAYVAGPSITSLGLRGGAVKGDGLGGLFIRDLADAVSPANPPYIVVTANGVRFKRADLTAAPPAFALSNIDATNIPTGVYATTTANLGTFPTPAAIGVLEVHVGAPGVISQEWRPSSSLNRYQRYYTGSSWSAWGLVLRAGEFGVGGTAPLLGHIGPLDGSLPSGEYQYSTALGSVDGPPQATLGSLLHSRGATGETQVFVVQAGTGAAQPNTTWIRTRTGGAWTSWSSGSLGTSGSNANGRWWRAPNGMQTCTRIVNTAGSSNTWTFPMAFSEPPVFTGSAKAGAGGNDNFIAPTSLATASQVTWSLYSSSGSTDSGTAYLQATGPYA